MTDKQFPQVADDELMLTQMPHMNLYDDGDFISNILGEYTDKNYLEWEPIATGKVAEQPYQKNLQKSLQKPFEVPKSRRQPMTPDFKEPVDKKSPANRYAEEAREAARADLKKKRTAPYLTADIASKSNRKKFTPSFMPKVKPTAPFQKETPGELIKYGERLKQEQLILLEGAEEHPDQESHQEEKPQKNNYDFLKKSQIYNKDQQNIPTRLIKQELNVTNLD